jgi:hypothetical protein
VNFASVFVVISVTTLAMYSKDDYQALQSSSQKWRTKEVKLASRIGRKIQAAVTPLLHQKTFLLTARRPVNSTK